MLSARRLGEIMRNLAEIPHVRVIRIHSRIPVADPRRITDEMARALRVDGATTWLAVHANHPRELSAKARAACARLADRGIPLVSQSVLLRGVNDDPAILEALMRSFVECRIKPYYLHHGDLAPGTAHLRTTLEAGQALVANLRGRVSGLCQPDYVIDIPGGFGKVPVGPNYLSRETADAPGTVRYRVTDYCGEVHLYPPSERADT
jgi:lysine 2,3-aminomutase